MYAINIVVEEGTTTYLTASFLDKLKQPAVPVGVTYDIQCITTKKAIKTDQPVTAASTIEITLDALDVAIQNSRNDYEDKQVTIKATYGTNDACNVTYYLRVTRLAQ